MSDNDCLHVTYIRASSSLVINNVNQGVSYISSLVVKKEKLTFPVQYAINLEMCIFTYITYVSLIGQCKL